MDQTKVLEEILKKGRYAITINNGTIEKIVKLKDRPTDVNEVVEQQSEEMRVSIESKATNLMSKLGIPVQLNGYTYIRDAIIICCCEKKSGIKTLTKELYPQIAEKYGTTPQRVERGIRTTVAATCIRGNQKLLKELFNYIIDMNELKPTNSEFISKLVDMVRMQ